MIREKHVDRMRRKFYGLESEIDDLTETIRAMSVEEANEGNDLIQNLVVLKLQSDGQLKELDRMTLNMCDWNIAIDKIERSLLAIRHNLDDVGKILNHKAEETASNLESTEAVVTRTISKNDETS